MSEHGERIWQRGSALEIWIGGRQRFKRNSSRASAHVGRAVDYYSLLKRYKGILKPLSAFAAICVAWHDRRAIKYGLRDYNQIETVSRHLAVIPWWLGGNKTLAGELITRALEYTPLAEPVDEMLPHTRALLLCTLASIEEKSGNLTRARTLYGRAWGQEEDILAESDHVMAMRQLVRVLSAVGFFFYDHDGMTAEAQECIQNALNLANTVSEDQAEKIIAGCRERGIRFYEDGFI